MSVRAKVLPLVAVLAAAVGAVSVATSPGPARPLEQASERLAALEGRGPEPAGVRFGVQLDWRRDSPAAFTARAGRGAAVYGEFVEFPFRDEVETWLGEKTRQVRDAGGVLMLTLQPQDGLDSVTPDRLARLTSTLRSWNEDGVPVLVRFAHEMNGAWYPWSQQPAAYVRTFRAVAAAVRAAPASRILWSPNEGGAYPYTGGRYEARRGTPDFARLDTNRDGRLTQGDDAYRPYYPGDAHVDWVGLSLYHFGRRYPWGANVPPERGKFVGKLTGTFRGGNGDERAVPNFYADYAARAGKPMAISETSALFNTERTDGATDLQIKRGWWSQVFAPDVPARFPRLRLIAWFEQEKQEQDVPDAPVDWTVTADEQVRAAFRRETPAWLVFG